MLCCRCDTSRRRCVPLRRSHRFVLHFFIPHSVLIRLTFLTPSFFTSVFHPSRLPSPSSHFLTPLILSLPFLPMSQLHTSPPILLNICLVESPSIPATSPTFIMGLPSLTDWPLAPLFLQHSLLLSAMSPCRRGGMHQKRTASQAEWFHGTHRSGLMGGASPFLFLVSDAVSTNCRRWRLKRQGRGGDDLGKVRGWE